MNCNIESAEQMNHLQLRIVANELQYAVLRPSVFNSVLLSEPDLTQSIEVKYPILDHIEVPGRIRLRKVGAISWMVQHELVSASSRSAADKQSALICEVECRLDTKQAKLLHEGLFETDIAA
jgi:hypothetical protein